MLYAPTQFQSTHLLDSESVEDQLESFPEYSAYPKRQLFIGATSKLPAIALIFDYYINYYELTRIGIKWHRACVEREAEPFYLCRLLLCYESGSTLVVSVSWYPEDIDNSTCALAEFKQELYANYPNRIYSKVNTP